MTDRSGVPRHWTQPQPQSELPYWSFSLDWYPLHVVSVVSVRQNGTQALSIQLHRGAAQLTSIRRVA